MSTTDRICSDARRKLLARVHCLKKEAGLDADTYRAALVRVTGKHSAALCTDDELGLVIADFTARAPKDRLRISKANADRAPLLAKIEAQLRAQNLSRAYAEGIAKRMFHRAQPGVSVRLEFLSAGQIKKIIASLEYRAKRQRGADGKTREENQDA